MSLVYNFRPLQHFGIPSSSQHIFNQDITGETYQICTGIDRHHTKCKCCIFGSTHKGLDARILTLLHAKNNGADQPALLQGLTRAFVISFLEHNKLLCIHLLYTNFQ